MNTSHHIDAVPPEIIKTTILDEKKHFEEILQRMEAGRLSQEQINAEIKSVERALRCLRYSRSQIADEGRKFAC